MLLPAKASGLARYSATSIMSSEMSTGLSWPAMRPSVSPGLTRYSLTAAPRVRRAAPAAAATGGRRAAPDGSRRRPARRRRPLAPAPGARLARGVRRRGDLRRLRRAQFGRIEQEGVFAHQAAAVPAQFEQHVDERFVERLRRGDLDDLAAAALFDREAQRQQGRIEFDVRQRGRHRARPAWRPGRWLLRSIPQSVRSRRAAAGRARTGRSACQDRRHKPRRTATLRWRPRWPVPSTRTRRSWGDCLHA